MENKQYFLCVHCNPHKYLKSFDDMKVQFNKRNINLTLFLCGQCRNKDFTLKSSLMRHIEYQHLKEESQIRADSNSSSSGSTEDENLTVHKGKYLYF